MNRNQNWIKGVCILLLAFLSFSVAGQEFRLDVKKIDQEFRSKKTVGEQIEYYRHLAQDCERRFGLRSYEYLAVQITFLDFYDESLPLWMRDTTRVVDTLVHERKKLIPITREVFGDTSFQFASAVIKYALLTTNTWNKALSESAYSELLYLFDEAINGLSRNALYTEIDKAKWIVNLYTTKSSVHRKRGEIDKMKVLLDSILSNINRYELTKPEFNVLPTTVMMYATFILSNNVDARIDLLDKYDSIVWNNFRSRPQSLLDYRKSSLGHRIAGNRMNEVTVRQMMEADSLCKLIYTVNSHEYVSLQLNIKIPILKKIGLKSSVFQTLAYLDQDVLKNNNLLSTREGLFSAYYLEWYEYLSSIGDIEKGITYLNLARKYADLSLNRFTFETTVAIFRALKDYYRYRDIDSCFDYATKLIYLQEQAQDFWGDRAIHEYHELAKLLLYTESTELMPEAREFTEKALKTFKDNYGTESNYYKSALFTMGQVELRESNYTKGLDKCWSSVYENLNKSNYTPLINGGLFDTYAEVLEKLHLSDSADFFNSETLGRNLLLSRMNAIGFDESMQLSSIKDIKNEQSYILSNHLNRWNSQKNDCIDRDLANLLTSKNLSLRLQILHQRSIDFAKKNKNEFYEKYRKVYNLYDSLINGGAASVDHLDTIFQQMESYKGWMLQDYYFSLSLKDKSNLEQSYSHNYEWIQQQLGEEEVFVDVVEFRAHDHELGYSNVPSYAFFLLDKKTSQHVQYFFLEEPPRLKEHIENQDYHSLSILLKGLIEFIRPYKKCIVQADGLMGQLNMGALSDPEGEILIAKKDFYYVSDRSAIERLYKKKPTSGLAAFMGNPYYRSQSQRVSPGIYSAKLATDQYELPYTRQEILEISETIKRAGWKTLVYMDTALHEQTARRLKTPTLLHVATHGFYIDDNNETDKQVKKHENRYLRSGLILSAPGTNSRFDNVLSSYEIMNTNWSDLSLVVLSACETAKGGLTAGEGVLGLQRALQVAGVNQMLITTHSVYDKSTQVMMKYFYEALTQTDTYADALRIAQRKMISSQTYSKSKYWAPFILIQN